MVKNRDPNPYRMCEPCAEHNVRNRGAQIIGAVQMAEVTHYPSRSKGPTPIKTMEWKHLNNAIGVVERGPGQFDDPDQLLAALKAEMANRPPIEDNAPEPIVQPERIVPMREGPAPKGDNMPPDLTLEEELTEAHGPLLDEFADAELAIAKLPATVQTEADAKTITDWVAKTKVLGRRAETARETAKKPFLLKGRIVDGFFGKLKTNLDDRAKAIEARNLPYLKAKAAAEEALQRAKAEDARKEAAAKQAQAQAAFQAEAKARQEAAAAAEKLRQALTAKDIAEARQQTLDAEQRAMDAEATTMEAQFDADRANSIAAGAGEAAMMGPGLQKSTGSAATAKLVQERRYEVTSALALNRSLGPLNLYLSERAIEDALDRAAKADPSPTIPGVRFFATDVISTTLKRGA